ncbi:hypothetical protein [Paenibacillus lactis]|uniref:hypothetical protein n=1 Tax=Paenibacillus lactis TaxID=228574 RepID=UPI0036A8A2D7
MSIQQLQQQIEQVRVELHAENQRGALKDSHKVSELETKLSDLSQQLDVELRLTQHEAKVEESHAEIAYFMDTLNVEGISMRELCKGEEEYQLLRAVVQGAWMQRDERRLNENKELDQKNAELKAEKEQLQRQYDELYEENSKQRHEIHQLQMSLEDANKKRDAAVSELEASQKEIERLNSQVDDLRKEIAVGAVAAAKTIDITESLEQYKRKLQEEKESKTPIYNVQPLDPKGSLFSAQYAETDEPLTFNWLEKGKYREVTAEEAEVFRAEYKKRMAQDRALDAGESALTPPPISFQEQEDEDTTTTNGLDQGYANGEVEDQAAGSIEERITALEQRVKALEMQGKGEAA